jgi:Flp pilus assembly protein TadD
MNKHFSDISALGFSLIEASRFEDAREAFRRAVLVSPERAIALYGLGFCALRRVGWNEGVRILSRAAISARPDTATRVLTEIQIALGHCQKASGLTLRAAASFRRAVVLDPPNGQSYYNLSTTIFETDDRKGAARAAVHAAMLASDSADYWNNAGRLLAGDDILDAAEKAYRRAGILFPGHDHAWNNLGILHKMRDELRRALKLFERARWILPDNADILANLGRNLLLTGDFPNGWKRLAEPWLNRGFLPRDGGFSLAIWDGSPLGGDRLLVWSEEKIGEEIMFSTMLEDVVSRAGAVTLLCNPRVSALLARDLPSIKVIGWDGSGAPPVDLTNHAACYPLEYIGRFVRRNFSEFPRPRALQKRPIAAGSCGTTNKRNIEASLRLPRVGVHWRSINTLVGDYKSLPLREWGPILSISRIDFVCLQYGAVDSEISEAADLLGGGPRVPAGVDQMGDIVGFAEYVAGLDLVISISSTTAHVSAALGLPTWVLLPRGPGLSWFWFESGESSPWYPDCRLYRQDAVMDWRVVTERAGRDLASWRDDYEIRNGIAQAHH